MPWAEGAVVVRSESLESVHKIDFISTGAQKKAWAVSVGGYVFSHKSSVYDPGKEIDLAVYQVLQSLLTELKTRIKFFFNHG
jgi:hypothetical protein